MAHPLTAAGPFQIHSGGGGSTLARSVRASRPAARTAGSPQPPPEPKSDFYRYQAANLGELSAIKVVIGNVARAIETARDGTNGNAAAIFAIAMGSKGGFSSAPEGRWFKFAGFKFLRHVKAVSREVFADAMIAAREAHEELSASDLVANATREDLLFIYQVAGIAWDTLPPPPDRDVAAPD